MSELFDDAREREWAVARFRPYLLGQLELDDAERVATAVALIPGFIDQLDQFEEELIEAYLDLRLEPPEKTAFEAEYERGSDPEKAGKLRLHEALRSAELKQLLQLGQPGPAGAERAAAQPLESQPERAAAKPRIVRRPLWTWQTAALGAACAAAIVLAVLYQSQAQKLNDAMAKLNSLQASPVPAAGPAAQVEQPAGATSTGGLVLPPASGTVQTERPPGSVIYSPVPDYRQQYEIRIYAASGQVASSGALSSKDNAIEYAPANAQALALPWDVFVLGPPGNQGKVLAHYILKP